MFLTVTGPLGHREESAVDNQGLSLGALLRDRSENVEACFYNGVLRQDWQGLIPHQGDRVNLVVKTGLGMFIGLIISMALSAIMQALTPKPKRPKQDSKRSESFGIAGYNNTTGPGTPRFVVYGRNRVYGHEIASGADVSENGREMLGKVLYFMGDTGGDQYQSISAVQVDDLDADQYGGMVVDYRLGADDQSVIPGFENVTQLYYDGRPFPWNTQTHTGTPLVYVTKSNTVQQVRVFFLFAGGLYSTDKKNGAKVFSNGRFKIEVKGDGQPDESYTEVTGSPKNYAAAVNSDLYRIFEINFASPGKYNIRITLIYKNDDTSHICNPTLFNVEEIEFTTRNYGGDALLALTRIPAKLIQNFQSMKVSALEEGKRVKIWNGSTFDLVYTRQRCWIVRDMLTHPEIGMGNEISEDEIPDDQWKEEQDYYDELVTGHDGMEARDYCDFITNESKWDWEYIRSVAGEGRGRIFPSGDKWKYKIDRPGTPNLLYAEGANVIENSVIFENSPVDRPFNQVIAEFRDSDDNYLPAIPEPITDSDIGDDPIVQEALRYDTITRESQVQRENLIYLKKAKIERRRWTFTSPQNAIVSEPMDLDYFAERSLGNQEDGEDIGPYSGLLPEGCTTTTILLPEAVTLRPAETYDIIVKHANNTVETREIATGNGTWRQLTVTSAFLTAPAAMDIFAIGIRDVEHIITRCQDLEMDSEGRIKQVRSEYIPDIWTPDDLPPKAARKYFKLKRVPPIQLRDAQVVEEIVAARDGSYRSVISFSVTPGLERHSGQLQAGFSDSVVLSVVEPAVHQYFRGAYIKIISGTGSGQEKKITASNGLRQAWVDSVFSTVPDSTSVYEIYWKDFGQYAGFVLEGIRDTDGSYNPAVVDLSIVEMDLIGKFYGTTAEIDGRGQDGTWYYRFRSFTTGEIENRNASPIVRGIVLQGDTSAPAAPTSLSLSAYLKNVTLGINQNRPTALDLAGYEVEFYYITGGTTYNYIRTVRVPITQDSEESGTLLRRHVETLSDNNYGDVIWCRARAYDYSNNFSDWVGPPGTVTLQEVGTTDIAPGMLSATTVFENAESQSFDENIVAIGSVTVTTDGGVITITANVLHNTGSQGMYGIYTIRSDSTSGLVLETYTTIMGDEEGGVDVSSDEWVRHLLGVDIGRPAGTYTYKLCAVGSDLGSFAFASNVKIAVEEIKR